jgi:hypothetical protein
MHQGECPNLQRDGGKVLESAKERNGKVVKEEEEEMYLSLKTLRSSTIH